MNGMTMMKERMEAMSLVLFRTKLVITAVAEFWRRTARRRFFRLHAHGDAARQVAQAQRRAVAA